MHASRLLTLVLVAAGCAAPPPLPLDQPAPGEEPALFAPGVVSTAAIELNGVLSPDGRELFFTRIVDDVFVMHRTRLVDGSWSVPEPVQPYAGGLQALAVDMAYAPDGQSLFFLGSAPSGLSPAGVDRDLWMIERQGDGWSTATMLPPPISTAAAESYPCIVADGSLYFSSRRAGGLGESDIYRAQRLPDGRFAAPVNLGGPVNTEHSEGDTWVAPDESVLVVTSSRPGGHGQGDLYVAFRTSEGGWSEPVNLGPAINATSTDFCPMGTWDGRYLFFSRREGASWEETTGGDVYWIDRSVLERFRP